MRKDPNVGYGLTQIYSEDGKQLAVCGLYTKLRDKATKFSVSHTLAAEDHDT